MRLFARIAIALLLLVLTAGGAVYWIVQPPARLVLPERGATLDGVTVIEPGRSRSERRRVVVRGDRIESVEASRGEAGPWAGLYVTPGLTDLHVHFPPASLPGQAELFAFQMLRHGVTAVRDAGDVDGTATEPARRGVAEERFPGPRIEACGFLVDGEPPLWKNTLLARDPDEGRRAVERVAAGGFDCVKAYTELDAPTLDAIREAAHARGLPVIGHVPRRIPYEEARLDDAQHLIGIPPPPDDEALRFPFVMKQWEQLDDARLDRLVAASARLGIANTPTLVTIDRLIGLENYPRMLREPDAALLPRFYRDVVWNPNGGITPAGLLGPEDFAMLRRALAVMQRSVKRLHDGGARVHSGTDTLIAFVVPGASLHRELRLYVDAGLSPEQALATSMIASAEALGVEGLGQVRAGAPAELLVFRDDPTRSLDALDSLAAVIRDGRLYPRESLDARLAAWRAHNEGAAYDAIVTPLVRRAIAASRR